MNIVNNKNKIFTDIFWQDGCRIPEILASEVVDLSSKGIMTRTNDETLRIIFECTIIIRNIPKGSTVGDIKRLLSQFSNEFYTERRIKPTKIYALLHFYSKAKADQVIGFLKNGPHQFTEFELFNYRDEDGNIVQRE